MIKLRSSVAWTDPTTGATREGRVVRQDDDTLTVLSAGRLYLLDATNVTTVSNRKSTSMRLPVTTLRKIRELAEELYGHDATVMIVAVDDLWRKVFE